VPDTIASRILNNAKIRPYAPAYYVKHDNRWRATSWKRYASEVKGAGKALIALGFQQGDKVSILGFNRPDWVILNVAAMAAGGAAAGIYTTCSAEEVQYIIDHAEASVVLLENDGQWQKVKEQRENLPLLKHVVMMRGASKIDDPLVMSWEEFMAKGDETSDESFDERLNNLAPDDLATLIYTSGTTGPPKGVMLSHHNLAWTAQCITDLVNLKSNDYGLSYLPLSHIAEQLLTIHGPATAGSAIYFAESIEKVPDNLKEVQPTVVFGVPRIWEKFYAGVSSKLSGATGVKK
jgi:long-chain acyl-CoA synthetase